MHPGRWLKHELVDVRSANITAIAKHLGMSRPALVSLFEGRLPLSAKLAIGFEQAFGMDAAELFKMQNDFEFCEARANQNALHIKPFDFS